MRIKGKSSNFAHAFKGNGSLAQLNRASDYGSEGCRFESCTNHITIANASSQVFAIFLLSMATVTAAPNADIKRKGGRARGHKAASQPKKHKATNTLPNMLGGMFVAFIVRMRCGVICRHLVSGTAHRWRGDVSLL